MPIDEKDITRLREIFITRHECQSQTDSFEKQLTKELVRLAVIETELSQIKWILTAVGGGVITMLVKMFFGG